MLFKELNLIEPILSALHAKGYEEPTPIQAAAIPPVLEGKDVLGCAQTGTGKTAAFALPILNNLMKKPGNAKPGTVRVLVLSPTRELAVQIGESFHAYGRGLRLRIATVFGGVSDMPQKQKLRQGVDILIATPGRLMDLHAQRALSLDRVEVFVLDEADRMMDMGFIHDVRRISALVPSERQTLFFSATMPPEIRSLAKSLLRDPIHIEVTPVSSAAPKIQQFVYMISRNSKASLLRHLLADPTIRRGLVFTRTKHGADRVCKTLERYKIFAEALHGNKTQGARQRALTNFKTGQTRILVATDIASRGIDVTDISHVFNFDLPEVPETYVHRIGRTGRAGASGIAYTFCDHDERSYLRGIERLIRQNMEVLPVPVLEETIFAPRIEESGSLRGGRTFGSAPRGGDRDQGRGDRPQRSFSNSGERSERPPQRGGYPSSREGGERQPQRTYSNAGGAARPSRPRSEEGFRPRSEEGSQPRAEGSFNRGGPRAPESEGAKHGRRPTWQKSRPSGPKRFSA